MATLTRFGPRERTWAVGTTAAALAAAVYLLAVRGRAPVPAPLRIPWWALAALFGVAELHVVHLHLGRDTDAVSLNDIPLVLGVLLATPDSLLAAQLGGGLLVLTAVRRQAPVKLLFNVANLALSAEVAVLAGGAIAARVPGSPGRWLAAYGAVMLASAAGCTSVALVVSAAGQPSQFRTLPRVLGISLTAAAVNASLALMAVTILSSEPAAVWLVGIAVAGAFIGYRIYGRERSRRQRLQFLYESSRSVQRPSEVAPLMEELLERAVEMFRAGVGELRLLGGADGEARRLTVGARHSGLDAAITALCESATAPGGGDMLLERGAPRADSVAAAAGAGVDDAMVVALRNDRGPVGTIVVANRPRFLPTFGADDLSLFRTFADHAGIAVENHRLELELKHQAFHDSLTQLANRALFLDRVEHALVGAPRRGETPAVVFLDLDDFKLVNDSLGHVAGDELLVGVARRLQACLRPADTAARLGGDEFAVLLEDCRDPEDAAAVARRIITALDEPFVVRGAELLIQGSIGVACSAGQTSAEQLLCNADVAMYRAKDRGKRCFELFEPRMQTAVLERHELTAELRGAVDRDELALRYQPIVRLSDGRTVGAEALIRWQHPQRGMVSPVDFLPVAEETGMIVPIGHWVLETACAEALAWEPAHPGAAPPRVSVNVSSRQLQEPAAVQAMLDAIVRSGLDPSRLVLEITESVLLRDMETTVAALQRFRELGVRIAIDDFGTGYSSLGYLRRLPIDIVKVDKTFVVGAMTPAPERSMTVAIVRLLETLDVETVVEGIEHGEQFDFLRAMGCDHGQGFLFSPAVPGESFRQICANGGSLWPRPAGRLAVA